MFLLYLFAWIWSTVTPRLHSLFWVQVVHSVNRIRVSFLDWLMSIGRWERLKSSPGNQNVSIFSLLIFCFTCMNHLRTQKHICKIYFQPHKATWYILAHICQLKRCWLVKNYRPNLTGSKLWELYSHSFIPSTELLILFLPLNIKMFFNA